MAQIDIHTYLKEALDTKTERHTITMSVEVFKRHQGILIESESNAVIDIQPTRTGKIKITISPPDVLLEDD